MLSLECEAFGLSAGLDLQKIALKFWDTEMKGFMLEILEKVNPHENVIAEMNSTWNIDNQNPLLLHIKMDPKRMHT